MPGEALAMIFTAVLAAGTSPPPDREPPDTELLEFLGTFESSDGKWMDPLTLKDVPDDPRETPREEKRP